MTSCEQRDVILVRFVFSEGTGFKKRPALVLSSSAYHRSRKEIILAAITSNVDRVLVGDTILGDWKKANLLFPSLVAGVIQTIRNEMVERKLGTLSLNDFAKVQKSIKTALGLEVE